MCVCVCVRHALPTVSMALSIVENRRSSPTASCSSPSTAGPSEDPDPDVVASLDRPLADRAMGVVLGTTGRPGASGERMPAPVLGDNAVRLGVCCGAHRQTQRGFCFCFVLSFCSRGHTPTAAPRVGHKHPPPPAVPVAPPQDSMHTVRATRQCNRATVTRCLRHVPRSPSGPDTPARTAVQQIIGWLGEGKTRCRCSHGGSIGRASQRHTDKADRGSKREA